MDGCAMKKSQKSISTEDGLRFIKCAAQPHPDNLALASTHPHHKHIRPDIKHNRARRAPAAPGLSFTQPNLPFLIEEIEQILL
jgi:hypothetical protein